MTVVEMAAAGGKPREMGKVIAAISVANFGDETLVARGSLRADQVRRVDLHGVLVDTGATLLCLPREIIDRLQPDIMREVRVDTAVGETTARVFRGISLTVEGRTATVDCLELPGGRHPLPSVFALEALGIELDLRNERLHLLPDDDENTYLTIFHAR